jgi:hypothetical protein
LDGTGKIRYTEFLAATIEAQGAISEERLAEAFDRMDADDSGFISKENLRELLGEEFPQSEIDCIIDEADLTRNGKISYSEFLALWEDKNEGTRQKELREVQDLTLNLIGSESGGSTTDVESDVEHESFDPASRISFIDSKRSSERKKDAAAQEDIDLLSNKKTVLFDSQVQTIPTVVLQQTLVEEEKGARIPRKHAAEV